MVLIFLLSSIPGSTLSSMEFPYAHLIAHSLLFGMLYYLAYRALRFQRYSRLVSEFSLLITLFFVMIYGASDEFHQSFIPGRTEEFKDFAIDVGAALVVLAFVLLRDRLGFDRRRMRFSSK